MLPCICPVIDHRWRQNVVRSKKWHMRRWQSVSLMFLPHFDFLCDLLLDRCTATWNLFVLCNKELKFVHIKAAQFFSRKARESGTFPILTNTQKAIWSHLWSKQNEAIPLVAMPCQELWLVLENHPSVKLDSSVASLEMKTYSEATIELRKLQIL